jgi:nucleoside-diphosphate-sugar epimerase
VEAEQLAFRYYRDFGVPVVVLRPGFVYGPRERHVLPALVELVTQGRLYYLGDCRRVLDTTFVRNLVDAVFLAADNPAAVGKAYNINDGEFVSKQRFIEAMAKALDISAPQRSRPLWLARLLAWCSRLRSTRPVFEHTSAHLRLLGVNADFSINRAREELGYRPRFSFDDGMAETMAWHRQAAVSYWRKPARDADEPEA